MSQLLFPAINRFAHRNDQKPLNSYRRPCTPAKSIDCTCYRFALQSRAQPFGVISLGRLFLTVGSKRLSVPGAADRFLGDALKSMQLGPGHLNRCSATKYSGADTAMALCLHRGRTGKVVRSIVAKKAEEFAFGPGNSLALNTDEHTIKSYDVITGAIVAQFKSNSRIGGFVFFSNDRKWLASGYDGAR